jgi:hypothetical protein
MIQAIQPSTAESLEAAFYLSLKSPSLRNQTPHPTPTFAATP